MPSRHLNHAALHLVDAFAAAPFAGNPAGIVTLDHAVPDAWMQQVALEMNQAETAFLSRIGARWGLRWFTPVAEVDLCGHATLAAAHVLWQHVGVRDAMLEFETRSGILSASRDAEGRIVLDFPAIASPRVAEPADLHDALGVPVAGVYRGDFDLLCEVESEAVVRDLRPDLRRLAAWDARGVLVTAPATATDVDFVSRCFFPALGVPEDPVTGSAHCALAPWWAARLGRSALIGRQLSPRGGVVACEVVGARVRLAGTAVTTVVGQVVA